MGDRHPDSLLTQDNYAELLAKLGRYEEAAALQVKSLSVKREILKPNDPELLYGLDKYVSTLYSLGRYPEAKPLYAETLQLHRDLHGEKDPRTLRALNDYAITLDQLGELDEAAKLSLQALTLKREILGPKHPDTLGSFNNYAALVFKLGRYQDAVGLFAEGLALFEEVLGEEDPQTLYLLGNYATALENSGQVQEALPIHKKALDLYRKILGPEHPQTMNGMNNYALSLQKVGRSQEAAELFKNALQVRRKVMGPKHPDTLASMVNYAAMLEDLGEMKSSMVLHEEVSRSTTEILGEKHPVTLIALANYSKALNQVGYSLEAEPIALKVLSDRRALLGNDHPDTMTSLSNYAAVLTTQRRWQEAENPSAEVYRLAGKNLPKTHPFGLLAMNNYAVVLNELGKFEQASALQREAFSALTEKLGEKHPETLKSMSNYGITLQNMGDLKQAEQVQRKALALKSEVLGEGSADRILSLSNYGWLLQELERFDEAEQLVSEAVALNQRLFGKQNPLTFDLIANLVIMRLKSENRSAFALDEARQLLDYNRNNIAAAGFGAEDQATLARNEDRENGTSILFADAAWSRGPGLQESGPSTGLATLSFDETDALKEDVFQAIQGAMSGSTNRAIARASARKAANRISSELGQLALDRQILSDEWIAADKELVLALSDDGDEGAIKRKTLMLQRDDLKEKIETIEKRLRSEAPEYFALVRPEGLALQDAQSLLKEDEAALLLIPGPIGTHVLAVTNNQLIWHRAEITDDEISDVVTDLRSALDQTINPYTGDYDRPFDRSKAYSLYKNLIAPVDSQLMEKSHLFIAATGALTSLPVSMLVTKTPEGEDSDPEALRNTPWLTNKYALVQIPSLQSLYLLRNQASDRPVSGPDDWRTFDGFGDPKLAPLDDEYEFEERGFSDLLSGTRNADGTAAIDIQKLKSMPSLPGTAIELKRLSESLNAPENSVRLQDRASEAAVRNADLSKSRVLAFATHGLLAGEITGAVEPGLVFTPPAKATEQDDGYLTSSEISTLNINADWVVLSACNTASGNAPGAPGLSGLARSFFYAGAKNLLVSHWPVRDDVASIITVDTIDRQKTGTISRAKAFQSAMKAIRDDVTDSSKAHPAAWAPFILVGDR